MQEHQGIATRLPVCLSCWGRMFRHYGGMRLRARLHSGYRGNGACSNPENPAILPVSFRSRRTQIYSSMKDLVFQGSLQKRTSIAGPFLRPSRLRPFFRGYRSPSSFRRLPHQDHRFSAKNQNRPMPAVPGKWPGKELPIN